jgi:hypothetical protein
MNKYAKFGAMIATSTLVMFGLMYLNTYALDHVDDYLQRAMRANVDIVRQATRAPVPKE